jgi:hypothetical protein
MTGPAQPVEALRAWLTIPEKIEKALEGLVDEDLDLRGGADGWSIRESVHHLVEANLVASNIVIAALARSGTIYDWSWVTPDASWMQRVGYTTAPVRSALDTLQALCEHIGSLIRASSDGFRRQVQLLDAPGAKLYTKTVRDILTQEVEHAEEHLRSVADTRAAHGR